MRSLALATMALTLAACTDPAGFDAETVAYSRAIEPCDLPVAVQEGENFSGYCELDDSSSNRTITVAAALRERYFDNRSLFHRVWLVNGGARRGVVRETPSAKTITFDVCA